MGAGNSKVSYTLQVNLHVVFMTLLAAFQQLYVTDITFCHGILDFKFWILVKQRGLLPFSQRETLKSFVNSLSYDSSLSENPDHTDFLISLDAFESWFTLTVLQDA
ncbi:hypothetical protein [Nostoc sp.]|uniref:hypothetical protein n=1 Tax=Nostoc sp. TaxID=1180 RepID=UPI002FF836BC